MSNLIRYGGTYLIENMLEGRVSASSIHEFNDPFELHHRPGRLPTPEEEIERVREVAAQNWSELEQLIAADGGNIDILRKKLAGNPKDFMGITQIIIESQRDRSPRIFDIHTKVICCTADLPPHSGEIPMWGYYAQCHCGIRVHYRVNFYQRPGIVTFPIVYKDKPVEFGFSESTPSKINEFVKKMLKTKSTGWNHESEVRLLLPISLLRKSPDASGIERWWLPINEIDIARIDLGIKYNNNNKLLSEFRAKFPSVDIFKTRKHPDAFLCQYEKLT